MSADRARLGSTMLAGLALSLAAPTLPAAAQPAAPATPSPIERFQTLPPTKQEALRNELQPLFFQSVQANGRLFRMERDCNMPVPPEVTPSARLEADLKSPDSSIGKLFGPARQGALLARFQGAMQTTIDCRQATDQRANDIQQLRTFPQQVKTVMERGLNTAAQSGPAAPDTMRAAPIPGVAPGTGPATAQQLPRVVIGAPGRCELTTGGRIQPCTSGLIYVQSREGPVLLSVQSTPTSTIGFQGNSDSQPRPEHYTLNLTRMHTSVDKRTAAKTVTGACDIDMTADGQVWHKATCRARDGNGLETVMTFTGDGRKVTAARPGEDQPKTPVAP